MLSLLALLFGACSLTAAQSANMSDVIVNTTEGMLRGRQFLIENMPIQGFFGIRYAEPPVGNLRWKRTIPAAPYLDVRDALQAMPVCPQPPAGIAVGDVVTSEDCLYLDVITGGLKQRSLKPVVVFINNILDFQVGISHTGVMLARRENLVVVTVFSRLGALGYLYDGPGTGNMGIYDNIEALLWVQRNIEAFGGDANKVTIMGLDSGATIAQLLAASPIADGLFHQVIAMSPRNVLAKSFNHKDDVEVLKELAGCNPFNRITCDTSIVSSDDIVQHLRHSQPNLLDTNLFPDGFSLDRLSRYPYLSGMTSGETVILTHFLIQSRTAQTGGIVTQQVMDDLVNSICNTTFVEPSARCVCFYGLRTTLQLDSFPPYSFAQVNSLISSYFHSMTIEAIDTHSKLRTNSTYAYIVDASNDLDVVGLPDNITEFGADKSVMTVLVFGYPFLAFGGKYNFVNTEFYGENLFSGLDPRFLFGGRKELRSQSQDVMRYWANFIKFGDPSARVKVDIKWPPYQPYRRAFLTIDDSRVVSVRSEFDEQRTYHFLNDFLFQSSRCVQQMSSKMVDDVKGPQ